MSQNLRILLTALVLLVGGYFIQKSVASSEVLSQVVDSALADTPTSK